MVDIYANLPSNMIIHLAVVRFLVVFWGTLAAVVFLRKKRPARIITRRGVRRLAVRDIRKFNRQVGMVYAAISAVFAVLWFYMSITATRQTVILAVLAIIMMPLLWAVMERIEKRQEE